MDNDMLERQLREEFNSHAVPESLSKDNIQCMLEQQERERRGKKSRRIIIRRIAAAAAVFAVAVGTVAAVKLSGGSSDIMTGEYADVYARLSDNESYFDGGLIYDSAYLPNWQSTADGIQTEGSVAKGSEDYSTTNLQVAGVDEADVVKTDGKYIYALLADEGVLKVFSPAEQKLVCSFTFDEQVSEFYLTEGSIAVIYSRSVPVTEKNSGAEVYYERAECGVIFLKLENGALVQTAKTVQSGRYSDSRAVGGVVYVVSDNMVWYLPENANDIEYYIPYAGTDGAEVYCPASSIYIYDDTQSSRYIVAASYSAQSGELLDTKAVLGGGFDVYCTPEMLFVCMEYYAFTNESGSAYTRIQSFALDNGKIEFKTAASVRGYINGQFALNYSDGTLFVCTTWSAAVGELDEQQQRLYADRYSVNVNGIFALDGELKLVGSLTGLGANETVRSVRYINDCCYFVTFEQTDPLFAVDISNPAKLTLLGELKVTGYSAYMHGWGDGLLFGLGYSGDEDGKILGLKLAMFDVSDRSELMLLHTLEISGLEAYSEALDNHKALYVDTSRGLVGLSLAGWGAQGYEQSYCVYSYGAQGFKLETKIDMGVCDPYTDGWGTSADFFVRGVRIGEVLYAVSANSISALSLESFELLYSIEY